MNTKVGVVIPTVSRHDALRRVVGALAGQTVRPQGIVIAVPDAAGVPDDVKDNELVKVVVTAKGASRQRNAAVRALPADVELVAFLDDDSIPRYDYIEQLIEVFRDSSVVAASGRVARDGAAEKVELTEPEIIEALDASRAEDGAGEPAPTKTLYGCAMAVRYAAALEHPFDEELALYSWLEDLDLARRLRRTGRVIFDPRPVVVHQGNNSGGRRQHARFGYSTVANPMHLLRKGSIGVSDLPLLVVRPTLANLVGAVRGDDKQMRRARLRGECLALADAVRGRMKPGRIIEMQ